MDKGRDASHAAKAAEPRRSARRAAFPGGRLETVSESGEVSRGNLLAAAARAFMENGFAATSIDDVAKRLGATKGLVYHHYRSKNDLFFDVCRRGMEIDFEAILPHAQLRERAITRLRRMCVAHVTTMMEKLEYQLVIMEGVSIHLAGPSNPEDRETLSALIAERDRYERLFRDTLGAAVSEGDVSATIDPSTAIKALLAAINSPVFWYRPREDETPEARATIARDLSVFALRGAGADATILEEEF
ncbi:MAG: TetR/AcrR family transcriptional regulator [Rhizobiaceae bacterium]|nr:TetR/AcrR family transcriptional regulator [Rhizobiaceae bacterium]